MRSKREALGLLRIKLDCVSDAEPAGNQQTALRPAEDPGNCAQVAEIERAFAPRRTRADLGVFEFADRRRRFEILQHLRVVDDIGPIKREGICRKLVESDLPFRQQNPGVVAFRIERIGAGKGVEACRNHQLQVALREDDVGVLPVQHFALLGDANLALEGAEGLGEDGAMRWAAAAADGASAAMKETQMHAALARYLVQGAMSAKDLPRAGEHAAVFVRIGVAEHDLLPVAP